MGQISEQTVKERLRALYIAPTERKRTVRAGIEIETPIVNLARKPVDFDIVHNLTLAFAQHFGFAADKHDDDGHPLALLHKETGDVFTFDCSYNTLELSLGAADTLREADARLTPYLSFVQSYLHRQNHTAAGLGTNPHRQYNNHIPIQNGRYRMLFHHLSSYKKYANQKPFFPYPAFGMFTAASQVHLDILPGKLIQILKVFNALEPFKSVLFANSPLTGEGLLLARDRLWADSMQGFNPRNIGAHDPAPASVDELLEYMLDTSIYCAERGGKYYNFTPMPLREYFKRESVTADYFKDDNYHTEDFAPSLDDLAYFRTFKFQDPTFRGTVEFRSVCSQPLRERLSVSAFHLGLISCLDETERLLARETALIGHGLSTAQLRDMFNHEIWPDFIDRSALRKTLLEILGAAERALRLRGENEEVFLEPLFDRADRLQSPAREYVDKLKTGVKNDALILDFSALN